MSKWWAAVALLLATCLALAAAGPAGAHAELIESEPSGGDVLAEAPEQVRLRFDEPVRFEESGGAEPSPLDPIKVYSEEGTRVDKTDTRASSTDPKVLIVDLKKLSDGVYGTATSSTAPSGSPWTAPAQKKKALAGPKPRMVGAHRRVYPWGG